MRRAPRLARGATLVALVLLVLVAMAGPAAADPAGPTNFRSEVTGLSPDVDGVELAVLGGDSFVQLVVEPGIEVVVPGYDPDELYLRVDADGRVFLNERSEAYFLNEDRYAATAIPPDVGPDAPPDWVQVAEGGAYAWHDHRVHWMSPRTLPPAIDPTRGEPQSYEWAEPIPIVVDGEPVAVEGTTTWYPDASPIIPLLGALLGLVLVLGLGWSRPTVGIVGGIGLAGAVALVAAIPANVGVAAGVATQPLQLILPAVAFVALAAGHLMRDRSPFALAVAGGGGLTLVAWGLTQAAVVTAPILPSGPDLLVRVAVGLAVGAGLGGFVLGVRTVLVPAEVPTDGSAPR